MTSQFTLPTAPDGIPGAIVERFNTGDPDAMRDLYAPEAVFVTTPGDTVSGWPEIRAQLAELIALGFPMRAEARHIFVAGDVAEIVLDWRLHETASPDAEVQLSGSSTDIIRRGSDGRWRMIIDNPFGTKVRDAG